MVRNRNFIFKPDNDNLLEFMAILLLSHSRREEELSCLGRPDLKRGDDAWDPDQELREYEVCPKPLSVITYVNSVRVAFCKEHISLLHQYFREKPEKEIFLINKKRYIDRFFKKSS